MEENIAALLSGIQRLGDAGAMPDTPTPVHTDTSADECVATAAAAAAAATERGAISASNEAIELSSFSVSSALVAVSPRLGSDNEDNAGERDSKTDLMKQALQTYTVNKEILSKREWKTVECQYEGIALAELINYPCLLVRDPVAPAMRNLTVSRAIGVIVGTTATRLAARLKDANHISRLKWDTQDIEDIAHVEEISSDNERKISLNLQWLLKKRTFFQRSSTDQLFFLWAAGGIRPSNSNPDDREWKLIWRSTDSNTHPKRPLYGSQYKREVFMQMAILTPLSPVQGEIVPTERTSVTLIGWNADYPGGVSKQLAQRLNFLQTLDKSALSQL